MSKPIDLKTVNIFEPLKKKPSFENKIFNTLNSDLVYEVLSNNSNETVTLWFKLQQSWCNNAYSTFKDYDSYLILVYFDFDDSLTTLLSEGLQLVQIKMLNIPRF